MPGLGVRNVNKVFLGMYQGMMTKQVTEGTANAIKRTKKNGKEVHEIHFNTLGGYFTDIRVKEDDQKRKYWVFVIEWDGIDHELSTGYTSIAAGGVLRRLKNMDFNQIIEFRSYWIKGDDEVDRGYLIPYINDVKVEEYYSRENPKEMPLPEIVTINNQEKFDYTKRMNFFKKQVVEEILPKMREAHPLSEAAVNESEDLVDENPFTDEELLAGQRQQNREDAAGAPAGEGDPGPGESDLPF